jgi:MFS family permease
MAFHSSVGDEVDTSAGIPRSYAWVVFALTFGLLISDYMSRQVLNAVFPLLKSEWNLSDSQLGLLSGVVALMVGLLTFPLSLLADRFGRVRSLALMALLWSIATLICGLAERYEQMFFARFLVGVGEAAYGSVGIAVVLSVFPKHMRATLTAAFMAGGMFGSLFGLLLAACYPLIVKESRVSHTRFTSDVQRAAEQATHPLRSLYASRSVIAAYIGSGLQLFVGGTVIVWMPSYLNRYYAMGTDKAGALAGLIVLCSGVGMILCGMLSDRLCRDAPARKIALAIAYCLGSCVLLSLAFALPPGLAQLALICLGMVIATGTTGPAGAMVANLTHYSVHGTAFATLTLANNLLGLAPGPFITGRLSDLLGLQTAFQLVPLVSIGAAAVFFYARRHYLQDIARLRGEPGGQATPGAVLEAQR